MDEQDCGDFLVSSRELDSFELAIKTARSKAEVEQVLRTYDLPEESFVRSFPDLAKSVQDLPDEDSLRA
ncbi:hypothetical protein ABZ946_19190 [Streptomyces sp. NPDC046324]|uniref:hypothetical protein n=1 Tax=Streptomyces sp. NPDC046324 TaxID=3154915 RepID=UPI0033D00922